MTASERPSIVVAVDPDPFRQLALVWGAGEADRRQLPLHLVHARGRPIGGYSPAHLRSSWEEWTRPLHVAAQQVIDGAVAFVENRWSGLEDSAVVADGGPAWVLCEQARSATAVVLGSKHLPWAEELFTSASVALPVLAHAVCPVVVVGEPEHVTQQPTYFVVGVDGSRHSAAAVDYAFEEAALRGAELRALYVWHPHSPAFWTSRQPCRSAAGCCRRRWPAAGPRIRMWNCTTRWSAAILCRC